MRSVPIYAMMTEHLPSWARKEIDSICRKFFWAGSDQSVKGKCMVAWPACCRPKELGGLGISDLQLAGFALQTRWLWLQQADEHRAWSQLPIRTCPQVREFFRASTYRIVGNGHRTLFWKDRWINGKSVCDIAPCLYSLVPANVRRWQSVSSALHDRAWATSITGGMSAQACIDYLRLWHTLAAVELNDQPDRTVWRWTANGVYTARSAYSMLHAGSVGFRGHQLIWKAWAPLKIKIFIWLAFRRRHWTADRRRRHGLDAPEHCFLCDQEEETIDRLIAVCPFTREVWFCVLQALGLQLPLAKQKVRSWWRQLRLSVQGDRRSGMDSLFALVSWQIRKERNARCFRGATSTVPEILQQIKAEADRWIEAGADGLRSLAAV